MLVKEKTNVVKKLSGAEKLKPPMAFNGLVWKIITNNNRRTYQA